MKIDAILMASGFSRRFGEEDKLLHLFRGKPLAVHTLELVSRMPEFDSIYFISASDAVAQLAEDFPVIRIHNDNPRRGSRESIRLGVQASSAEQFCFFPCDQPFLDACTVHNILSHAAKDRIVCPTLDGIPNSPSVFSARFREELLTIPAGEQGRSIRKNHPESLIFVPITNPHLLADIDTLEETTCSY
ncbi:MAG: nucleotidyltransferase family protein [Clostridiales Family XIII bacterium]|jgi:molybdenum cofactor cytidylyltransferase|nr:nucleotidyltransferase family protein [Clostridiales Family XIII bacterium]